MSPRGSRTGTTDASREAVLDARVEAAVAVLIALALLVVNGLVSRWQGWRLPGTPWWTWIVLAVPEVLLLILLVVSALGGVRPGRHRDVVIVLLGVLALASLTATGLLLWGLATADLTAGQLLLNAMAVWSTNLIIFGLLFWELDGGGPLQRVVRGSRGPDFQFPQDVSPDRASTTWRPRLLDYMYVSLTNSVALSPTDAMPLSRRAKSLMGLESVVSTVIVVFVIARAVNVLNT
jgi:hypothetical protein